MPADLEQEKAKLEALKADLTARGYDVDALIASAMPKPVRKWNVFTLGKLVGLLFAVDAAEAEATATRVYRMKTTVTPHI
jgi:hypothetical protein